MRGIKLKKAQEGLWNDPWQVMDYNHPINPNAILPPQISSDDRNPNLYSAPNIQPIQLQGMNSNGSPDWRINQGRRRNNFNPTDLIYGLNAGLRGFSEMYNNNLQQQYIQSNLANPIPNLPINDERSDNVAYGYSQFKEGGFKLNKENKGDCTPISKSTCTGKKKTFALNAKHHFKKWKHKDGGEILELPDGGKMSSEQFQQMNSSDNVSSNVIKTGGAYDTIPSYLYYVEAAQENNQDGMKKALMHVGQTKGQDAMSSLNFLGNSLKGSNINSIAKRGIDNERDPEMRKLYSMVNENPDILNNFNYQLPQNNSLAKFAYGGSAYRSKILDYLYSDDDSNEQAVIENTAPPVDDVEQLLPQEDNQDDIIASILARQDEQLMYNPYKQARKAFDTASKGKSGFQSFATKEEGKQALLNQLSLYQTGKTKNKVGPESSLYEAMSVYAPALDNNNPKKYAEFIANRMGVSPNTKLRGIDINAWAEGIIKMEGSKDNNVGNLRPYKR